jgi:hypothetical protein
VGGHGSVVAAVGDVPGVCYNAYVAPLPVIANTVRVSLNWIAPASSLTAANVLHFRKSGGTASDLVTKIDSHVAAGMWGTVSHLAQVDNIVATPLDGGTVSATLPTGSPTKWQGAGGSGDFIPQAATVIKLLTGKRGRSYRGRIFLPFLPEASQSQGNIVTGDVDAEAAAWVTFQTAMIADGWIPVVASYVHATAEAITGVSGEYKAATQRRRQKR